MNRTLGSFLLASLLLVSAASAQTTPENAELLLRKSGTWEQLGGMEAQTMSEIARALPAGKLQPSPAEMARLEKVVASVYAAPKLRAAAARVVADKMDERHLREVLQWYDSPTGQAITKVEEQFSATALEPQLVVGQGLALLQKGSEQRRQLIADLVRETKAADGLVEVTINIALAVQRGVQATAPGVPGMSGPDLRASLEAQRPAFVQVYEGFCRASFAVMYNTLPDADLEKYIAFWKSDAGAHFNGISMLALDRAFSSAGEAFGAALAGTSDKTNI